MSDDNNESKQIGDCIVNDDSRASLEKETSITFNGDEDHCRIYSAQRTVVQSLVEHSDVTVTGVSIDDSGTERIITVDDHVDEDVYAVWCDAPVGLLKVRSSPRSQDYPSQVVSNQEDVQFGDNK